MLPTEFVKKYQTLLGPEAPTFFAALTNGQVKKAFRVNPLKAIGVQTLATDRPVPGLTNAYYGRAQADSSDWVSGTVYSQEPAAMFPAAAAPIRPGQRILDLCAAPGGKSTALAERLQGRGLLVANEISPARAKILRENLERWGVTNAVVVSSTPAALAEHFPAYFDCILVDAPCSGEGMFRKNPEAEQYWSPAYVQSCQQRQKKILQSALVMLKAGGTLIYSTCTFSPEEDEQVVDWLGQQGLKINALSIKAASPGRPEWTKSRNPALAKTLRFWPQTGVGEGQFLASLHKPGRIKVSPAALAKRRRRPNKHRLSERLSRAEQALVTKTLSKFNLPAAWQLDWSSLQNRRRHVVAPALTDPALQGLHVLSNGVELGRLRPHRFVLSHQLAEVCGQAPQKQVVDLPDVQAFQAFLHGETVRVKSQLHGFVLVSYHQQIFSFGKLGGDHILKNFYPKGLRR